APRVDYCKLAQYHSTNPVTHPPPDKVLEVGDKATQQQIRDAYKKQALKHHPDRVPADSPERPVRTKRFQQVNDAYYTLSDPSRRRDYDSARSYQSFTSGTHHSSSDTDFDFDDEVPRADGDPTGESSFPFNTGFPWSAFGFGSAPGGTTPQSHERFSSEQFGGIFEEMLREEGMAEGESAQPTGKFWSMLGGASGAAMGVKPTV
ncbi:hypothetical protein GRF29_1536g882323, partial [Pseudopithomyces chartarum]